MLNYPGINPVLLNLGPFQIRWYGLMYLLGFVTAWILGRRRAGTSSLGIKPNQVDDLIFYCLIGLIVGARLGYVVFYDLREFLANPFNILAVWRGGMSFHGGFIGVMLALFLFSRRNGFNFFDIGDFLVPLAPPGIFAGRIGNFINGELWGRPTSVSWGMVFPGAGSYPRHPSQLYEAFLEGIVLFVVLWVYSSRPRPRMAVSGLFVLLYGLFRFLVEFFREPDAHLGFIALGWLSMGQLLSLPLIVFGLLMFLGAGHAEAGRGKS